MDKKIKEIDMNVRAEGRIPTYGTEFSAGMDLYCNNDEEIVLEAGQMGKIPTGLYIEIPEGYFGAIYPRSSAGTKLRLTLANSTGIIDSDYRGEISLFVVNNGDKSVSIKKNDRLAQMVIQPYVKANIKVVDKLEDSLRGEGGFGSTGR